MSARSHPARRAPRGGASLSVIAATLVAWLATGSVAGAHTRSESYSRWTVHGAEVVGTITMPVRESTRLGDDATAGGTTGTAAPGLATQVEREIELATAAGTCRPLAAPMPLVSAADYARVEWRVRCPGRPDTGLRLRIALLQRAAPSHTHFARIAFATGGTERVFTAAAPEHEVRAPTGTGDDAAGVGARFFALGVEHVATGWDHLAFLVALVLLAPRVRELAWLVTGFTFGHAAALVLATLGAVRAESALVEALIGFTIAITAARALLPGNARGLALMLALGLGALAVTSLVAGALRPAVAGCGLAAFAAAALARDPGTTKATGAALITIAFGIVHGLGFAGALAALEMPRDALAWSLAAFNLGVETGQLAIVLAIWLLVARLGPWCAARGRHGAAFTAAGRTATALALCALGSFWFVQRWLGA